MVTLKKPMVWKEEDGTKYKISYSEKLQLEHLKATKHLARWQKRNFYAKLGLLLIFFVFTAAMFYVFVQLDSVDFFTKVMHNYTPNQGA